jgi:cobalt/nickel transport system permease protein
MEHNFLDKYSKLDSPIHRLDPRVKLSGAVVFVLTVALTPAEQYAVYAALFGLLAVALVFSHLPLGHVTRRSLVIIPFVVLVGLLIPFMKEGTPAFTLTIAWWDLTVTREGLTVFLNTLVKAWLSIFCLIILSSSTSATRLFQAMQRLGLPEVMVTVLSFMYRYLFILQDEVLRLERARQSRSFGADRRRLPTTLGYMAGSLFIRSYERGERIYAAMLARGYDGTAR